MPRRHRKRPAASACAARPAVEALEPRLLLDGAPAAPSDLAAVEAGRQWVELAWQDNSADETHFRIERRAPGGDWATAGLVGPGLVGFHDAGLDMQTRYAYRVLAVSETGESLPSNAVAADTLGPFVDLQAALADVEDGTVAWGDYDGDGDLDLLVSGTGPVGDMTVVYRNDDGTFVISATLVGVHDSAAAWGDYDGDGDLDLLLNGQGAVGFISRLYRNDDGVFVNAELPLTPGAWGSATWADYDGDGDLDGLMFGAQSGSSAAAEWCRNDAGLFAVVPASLPDLLGAAADWGDYDGDGDEDLLIAGLWNGWPVTRVYRNDGGQFVGVQTDLAGVAFGTVQWGDYDADGDLDILLAGQTDTGDGVFVYRNRSGRFQPVRVGLEDANVPAAAWADYDNDGDLDALLHGNGWAEVYAFDGQRYAPIDAGLEGVSYSAAAWGDADGDGYVDILLSGRSGASGSATVYRNTGAPSAILAPGSRAYRFRNGDGRWVTVRLNGPGMAEVHLDPSGPTDVRKIVVSGTTARSSVVFSTGPTGLVVGDLLVYGPIGRITGTYTSVAGDVRVTGTARRVQLGDVRDDHLIEINAYELPRKRSDRVSLLLGAVADTTLDTHGVPIDTLRVVEWLDGEGDDLVLAPWIGSLKTTGRRARGGAAASEGDFDALLRLSGSNPGGRAVGSANVAGTLGGTWDLAAPGAGFVGGVRAGDAEGWRLDCPDGRVVSLTVLGDLTAVLEAFRYGPIRVRGDVSASIVAHGASGGGVSISRFTAGLVRDSELIVPGGVGSVRVVEWLAADGATDDRADVLSAAWVGSLRTLGRKAGPKGPASDGDFEPAVQLDSLSAARPRQVALGSARIAGSVVGAIWDIVGRAGSLRVEGDLVTSTWFIDGRVAQLKVDGTADRSRVAAGDRINAIVLGRSLSSDFLAGVAGPVDPATIDTGDVDLAGKIGSVRITGWRIPKGQAVPRFAVGNRFVAASIGTVELTNAAGLAGAEFIVLGGQGHIRTIRHKDTADPDNNWTWRYARPYPDQWLGATPWDVL